MGGPLAVWGWPLFRRSCWGAAWINAAWLVVEGWEQKAPPSLWGPRFLLSLLLLLLPYTPSLSERQRSWWLAITLFFAQALILASVPWSPAFLLMGALVVVGAGLSSAAAVVSVAMVQSALLFIGGWVLAPHAKSLSELHLDPRHPSVWMVAGVFLLGTGATLVSVLQRILQVNETAWEKAIVDFQAAQVRVEHWRAARDVRRRMETEIRDDAKLFIVATLSRGLAHLINNFLMTVRGALQEMQDDLSPAVRTSACRGIAVGLDRVSRTLKALMAFSRRASSEAKESEILGLVQAGVAHLQTTLSDRALVRVQGEERLRAKVDTSKFQQLVASLALNAIEASNQDAEVLFTVRSSQGFPPGLEVVVEDNGTGMEPEVLARVTEPFFSTKGDSRHPGLGLMAVWGIVQESGGTLQFESTPGVGTRVTVWLPRVGEEHHDKPAIEFGSLHAGPLGRGKALDAGGAKADQPAGTRAPPWKERLTLVFSRWSAAFLGMIWVAGTLQGWSVNRGVWSSAVVALIAGVIPMPQRVRLILLLLSCWPVVVASAVQVAFPSPISLVGLLLPVAWATLLGTPTLGWLALLGSAVGLTVTASAVMSNLTELPAALDPRSPQVWFRIGVNAALVQLMLGISVVSIVSFAKRAIAAKVQAEGDLLAASTEEEQEDARRTELERERARSGKFSSSARMIGMTVHDLASAVQGFAGAEFLADPQLSTSEAKAELSNLWDVYRHCVALAAQFVANDQQEPHVKPPSIDLSEATERAVQTIAALVPERIQLKVETTGKAFASLQESELRRLLFNLVTNARDAIEGHGTIQLVVSECADQVELRVSDTGKGIDAAVQARLFQPFFTTKPEGLGTGLGLYSVYQLVTRNGGTITVESPGAGATFVCRFPRSAPTLAQRNNEPVENPGSNTLGRVLVIDDEPLVRRFISRTLERAGYSTLEGSDGISALELVKRNEPCVALCIDNCMPGVAGIEVMTEFRKRNPEAPIVVCSGMISEAVESGHNLKGIHFVPKPFEPQHLIKTLGLGAPEVSTSDLGDDV